MAKSSAEKYLPSKTTETKIRSDNKTVGKKTSISKSTTSSSIIKKEGANKNVSKNRSQLSTISNRPPGIKKSAAIWKGLGASKALVWITVVINIVILTPALTLFAFKIKCDMDHAAMTRQTSMETLKGSGEAVEGAAELPPELISPGQARDKDLEQIPRDEGDNFKPITYECGVTSIQPDLAGSDNINGAEAVEYSWPYTLHLLRLDRSTSNSDPMYVQYKQICAAILIAPKHAITAALCFVDRDGASSYFTLSGHPHIKKFVFGDTRFRMVEKIRIHPKTNLRSGYPAVTYDFALLTVHNDYYLTDTGTAFACLPTPKLVLPPGRVCWVSGWGWTDPRNGEYVDNLRQVSVDLISEYDCRRDFYGGASYRNSTLCGGSDSSKDMCIGGTGAPLYCMIDSKWTLYGISSYGRREICDSDYYTPYGAVSFQMKWICCYIGDIPPCVGVTCDLEGAS